MSAKEMFEELDFTLIKCNEQVLEYENPYNENIYFDKNGKYYADEAIMINMKLHKAINKQIEELGWNK